MWGVGQPEQSGISVNPGTKGGAPPTSPPGVLAPSSSAEPAGTITDGEEEPDSSAAIDWLLKQSRPLGD
jgi:hypothetical protein